MRGCGDVWEIPDRHPPHRLLSSPGAPLSPTETQQLLFGSDDKCFTRMTPVLLLLAKSRWEEEEEVALAPSSYLSADGVVDMAPYPQLRSVALAAAVEKRRGWELGGERGSPNPSAVGGRWEDVGQGPLGYKGTL